MSNELLNPNVRYFELDFAKLTPQMFDEALGQTFDNKKKEIEEQRKKKVVTYADFESSPEVKQFNYIFTLLTTLNMLKENAELRLIEEKYMEKSIELNMEYTFDKVLFKQLEKFVNSEEFTQLSNIRKKILNKELSDWKKSGIDLNKGKQKRLEKLKQKASKLQIAFNNNVTDADKQMFLIVSKNSLRGLSERSLNNAQKLSVEKGVPEGKLYIDEVSGLFSDVMMNVRNERVRKKIYNLRKNKCLKGKFNNTKLVDQIYKSDFEAANILGYKNTVAQNVEDNMAANPERIASFIEYLGNEASPIAKQQINELYDYGSRVLKREVNNWDIPYVYNKMEEKMAKMNQEELKKYFPVDHVVAQLFNFCKEKFKVEFKEKKKMVWHEDVKHYDVYENDVFIGSLFMDLYRREGKSDGAWLSPISSYTNNEFEKSHACALLVCNVSKDIGTPTFTFNDVVTLFHEMGHGLHLLLSKVSEQYYSGFGGVQFDAIEFPSQLLESFVYNADVLRNISKHIETEQPLNNKWIKKIQANRKFMGARRIMTTLMYSDIDQKLNTQNEKHPFEIEREVKLKWAINSKVDLDNYMTKTFRHIFGGGYAANYYVYQWAEVMAADAYNYLTEKTSPKESQERFNSYKHHVLYTGGEQSMNNNYYDFAKREPQVKSLIEQYI